MDFLIPIFRKKRNRWVYLSAVLLAALIVSVTYNFVLWWMYEDFRGRLEKFGEETGGGTVLENSIEDYKLMCNDSNMSDRDIQTYFKL
jgi:hypothetical protein